MAEPMSDQEEAADWLASGKASEREARRRDREQSRGYRSAYRQGVAQGAQVRDTARRVVPKGEAARRIVSLMGITVVFALISTEIEAVSGQKATRVGPGGTPVPVNGVRVIIGGAVATGILLILTETGDTGAELAQGLALTTMLATVLIKGAPVWDLIVKVQGGQVPLKPVQSTTGATPQPGVNVNPSTGTGY